MPTDDQRDLLRNAFSQRDDLEKSLNAGEANALASETGLSLLEVESFALEEGIVPEKYDRNMGTLGFEGQLRLLGSRVVVVGLGGLGGHVVEILARLGVGRIVGVDGDRFVESNWNRQLLSTSENLGRPKAEEAAKRAALVNPAVEFTAYAAPFESLGDGLFRETDLVFDCLDSIPARRVLEKCCAAADVALVHGAIAGWYGQVAVCPPGSGMFEKIYPEGKRGIEKKLGNLPFTAAVAANLMAARAVPILLGEAPPKEKKLQIFDLLEWDWETIELF